MPFPSSNPKPLSTLGSRNILSKENVPKPSLLPASNKKGTTSLVTKRTNSSLTTSSAVSILKQSNSSSVLHEPSKPITRLSQAPKLGSVISSKGVEKENALVERSSTSATSRIPLRAIKKPASATRSATHTTVYARAGQGLKASAPLSSTSATNTTSSSITVTVPKKVSAFPSNTLPTTSTSISLTSDSLLSTSTLTTTNANVSTSKGAKSVPKKRLNVEDPTLLDSFDAAPRSLSPTDSEKENVLYPHATSYPSTVSKEQLLTDDFVSSLTSTSRSKKLRMQESKSNDVSYSKPQYKPLQVHAPIAEEEEEKSSATRRHTSSSLSHENQENETVSHGTTFHAHTTSRRASSLTVSDISSKTLVGHAIPLSKSKSMDTDMTLVAKQYHRHHPDEQQPLSQSQSQSQQQQQQQRKESIELMLPPSSMSLSEKMRKFGIPEIDLEDVEDVVLCAEYAQEILEYLLEREKMFLPNPNYITLHPEIAWHMRAILVDWLMEVHHKFHFLPETLYLCVNIMDRFLSKRTVSLTKFQLVGLASLFIAAKIEEIFCPPVANFSYMADSLFGDDDMLNAEKYILKTLVFDTWAPGPLSFIRRISKIDDYDVHHRTAAKFFTEASVLDHRFLVFPPSLIAASAMYLARYVYQAPEPCWDASFAMVSGYMESDLMDCVRLFIRFFNAPLEQESFFFSKKYKSRTFLHLIEEVKALAHKPDSGMFSNKAVGRHAFELPLGSSASRNGEVG